MKSFTPLEKSADFNRRPTDSQARCGLMPPSALTVRERSSLTGFTLLEVLISAALFTAGVVIIIGLFSAALFNSIDPENTGIAMTLAEKRMEEIQNLNFDTGIINEPKADVPDFSGFQRSVNVTEPNTGLKQVTVDVYWWYKGGETNVSLVTYISQN